MEDIKKTVDIAEVVKDEQTTDKKEEAVEEVQEKTEEIKDEKAPFELDYEKLAEIVNGKQAIAEDKVLSGYFKDHGLSAKEAKQAMEKFKEQKAMNTPDISAIQGEVNEALKRALDAETQNKAMLMASELGVDIKAMPYLVRMANVEDVTSNGKVDEEKLRSSLEEVISAMPQLKQTTVQGGFQVVGADTTQNAQTADDKEIERAFGIKK